MHRIYFAAAAAFALSACGLDESARNDAAGLVDEQALIDAVEGSLDRQALEGVARGAVEGAVEEAVREALPVAEIGAAAAVIDEKALVEGVDAAIAGGAIGNAVEGAVERPLAPAAN